MEIASPSEIVKSFLIGARFHLRMSSYAVLPVIFVGVFTSRYYYRFCLAWLTTFAGIFLLLGMIEFEFYGEFQQRLNILVVQYLEEDPATVTGMIWNGFPVVRYLTIWLLLTGLSWFCCTKILPNVVSNRHRFTLPVVVLMLFSAVLFARGTIKSGPPLRWGDAYHSEIMFVNHLGLNGSFTFFKAIYDRDPEVQNSKWKES
jgi:hypothetical protein